MRISEVYLSIQGEGPRIGIPTVFVRFGGCNLRCSGWPCDTPHAIDPAFRKEWKVMSPEKVYEEILKAADGQPQYSVCFTGGEPFLQKHDEIDELINILVDSGSECNMRWLECFSNGTLLYTELARETISFVMDWKLPGSGEDHRADVRLVNFSGLAWKDVIKFTIKDRRDYEKAREIYYQYSAINDMPQWYYGAVWGEVEAAELIQWVLTDKLPWTHTMQSHNFIWNRELRGI